MKEEKRDVVVRFKVTPSERRMMAQDAHQMGLSVAAFVRLSIRVAVGRFDDLSPWLKEKLLEGAE